MSIEVVENNEGLFCVKWTTTTPKKFSEHDDELSEYDDELSDDDEVSTNERKTDEFQLNRYRYLNCISNFSISLAHKSDLCYRATNNTFNLYLKQLKDYPSLSEEKKTNVEKVYGRQPCTVWMTAENNKDKKIVFKKPSTESDWKSDDFTVTPLKEQLTFLIWIQFNTFGLGEMTVLVNQLTDMFIQQINCDVQFHLPRNQKIGGHVSILAARSPVFAIMFTTDMLEAKTGKVVIKDIKPEIFKELLHFIYSGRTKESLTEETAQPLIIAADKYDVKSLKKEGVRYLLTQIRASNAIDLLIWGHLHSAEKLKNAALNFVAENFKTIFETIEWQGLTESYPELCLLTTRRMVELPIEVAPKKKRLY